MPESQPPAAASTCPLCGGSGTHDLTGTDLMFGGDTRYDYDRCSRCGLVYLNPLPTPEQIATFYPDSYSIYTEPRRPHFSRRALLTLKYRLGYDHLEVRPGRGLLDRLRPWKKVEHVVPWVAGGRALDIGCGNGEYLLRLKSIGWTCKGVEFNDKAVEICRRNGLDVFHGDLEAAALDSESFDFVTAHHLLEHVPDPHRLMAEIARVTRSGGHVLIRTPNSRSIGRALLREYWFANEIPRHLMLYDRDNLNRLAAGHGLQPQSLSTPVKPKLLLRSLDYKTGNRGSPSEKKAVMKALAMLYVPFASLPGRGDELAALYRKV